MSNSSIGCGGQNSLEAESLWPNSPLGEWINDDDYVWEEAVVSCLYDIVSIQISPVHGKI